jgi:hypothetical protein
MSKEQTRQLADKVREFMVNEILNVGGDSNESDTEAHANEPKVILTLNSDAEERRIHSE